MISTYIYLIVSPFSIRMVWKTSHSGKFEDECPCPVSALFKLFNNIRLGEGTMLCILNNQDLITSKSKSKAVFICSFVRFQSFYFILTLVINIMHDNDLTFNFL